MTWKVQLTEEAARELGADDHGARFNFIRRLIEEHGLERIKEPHVGPIRDGLFEMRLHGASGISRALFVKRFGKRAVVVRVFVKKTQKTPPNEIGLAQQRAKGVT